MRPKLKLSRLALAAAVALAATAFHPLASSAQSGTSPTKEDTDRRIKELEDSIQQLKKDTRGLEVREEDRSKVKPFAGWQDGFFIQSPDGNFKLKLGGYAQADARVFVEDTKGTTSQFLFRRIRPDIRGTLYKYWEFRFVPDFAGSSVTVFDAYLDAKFLPEFQVRGGKFKTPIGIERLQSATALSFVERSLATNLVPTRDIGFQLQGDLWRGALSYSAGIFNGVPDLGNGNGDVDDDKDFAGRVFAHPFKDTSLEFARGLGIGIAGSYGHSKGSISNTNLGSYRTPGQNTFFAYRTDNPATTGGTTIADGARYRFSPQGYWYYGPVGLLGEYVQSTQGVRRGANQNDLANNAWQLALSWVVTGEEASYKGVKPANNFDPFLGTWGALQLAARYAQLTIDKDAFTQGYADPSKSAQFAKEYGLGLNWYLNPSVLLAFTYELSKYNLGATGSTNRDDENVFTTRVQLAF